MPTFDFEKLYTGLVVAGIDEAGLGPLAGPIVVSACVVNNRASELLQYIDDSKRLSQKKREFVYQKLINNNDFILCTAIVSNTEIDNVGLANAWRCGVLNVVDKLKDSVDVYLIDGNKTVNIQNKIVQTIVKGDQKSFSIAAASIVAKVTRDNIMQELHYEYPEYGFGTNVGYGTSKHIAALQKFGPTKYHRLSFAKVNNK